MAFQDMMEPIVDWRVGGLQDGGYPSSHVSNWSNNLALGLGTAGHTPRRFYVFASAPPTAQSPAAGVAVHGVTGYANEVDNPPAHTVTSLGLPAIRGLPFRVESGAAFSAGAALKTDSSGRAIAQGGTGTIVATALEAATGAGEIRWAVFT